MKSLISKLIFASLSLTTIIVTPIPTVNVMVQGINPHDSTHPSLRGGNTTHIAHGLPNFLRSGAVIGSVAFVGAFVRLYNKQHNKNRLSLLQALNPRNVVTHPIQCIDDGLIGHIGVGHEPSYGVLGTTMAWVPKIDYTIIAVDQTKRKVEAWFEWLNRNIAQIDTARANMALVGAHAQNEFGKICTTIGSYLPIRSAASAG